MLSVAVDLSLQGALWAGSTVKASSAAVVVPFRIDAARVLAPAVDPNRIDGDSAVALGGSLEGMSRIDGVMPVGDVAAAPPVEAITFSQIDLGSVFSTELFERDPATDASDKGKEASSVTSDPSGDAPAIDWSRFEVFQDVTFTFAGGQIHAGLPTAEGVVAVEILVNDLPRGMARAGGSRTGIGDFFARLGSLAEQPSSTSTDLPSGSDPLGLPGGVSGDGSTPSPPAAPPASDQPANPITAPLGPPSADRGGASPGNRGDQQPAGNGGAGQSPQHGRQAAMSSAMTVAGADHAAGRLGAAEAVQVVGVAHSLAGTPAAGGAATPALSPAGDAQTTMLLPAAGSAGAGGDTSGEWTQYLLLAAGTQLSTLSSMAQRVFGAADPSLATDATAPPEIDYDALRDAAPFVALGLSPWQSAVTRSDGISAVWKATAGISLIIAVGGYWYCKEYMSRRRQDQLASCHATLEPGCGHFRRRSPLTAQPRQSERMLIGRISRLWRDEIVD